MTDKPVARFHPDMRSGIPLGTLNQRLERGTFTRKVKFVRLNLVPPIKESQSSSGIDFFFRTASTKTD